MSNWPPSSVYERYYGPIEVEGGLLFEPDRLHDAEACVERLRINGIEACMWTYPGDIGIQVSIGSMRELRSLW